MCLYTDTYLDIDSRRCRCIEKRILSEFLNRKALQRNLVVQNKCGLCNFDIDSDLNRNVFMHRIK